jgi:hypothetical protein
MAGRRPNAQNISALKTKIGELSQTNVFQVSFLPPNSVFQFIKDEYSVSYDEKFELLCNSATLPGSRLATHEQTQDFYGIRERYAYRKQFDETIQVSFYVDNKYDVITLFEGWQDYIMGIGSGANQVSQRRLLESNSNYRVSYPKGNNGTGYVTNIFISKFEKDLRNNLLEYTFTDAFPISFNSMPVQYGQAEVLQMTVDFAYTKYVRKVQRGPGQFNNARGTVVGSVNSRPGFVTEEILLPSGEIVTRDRRI